MMRPRTKAELYLLACTFVWGGTFVLVKGGLDDASPLAFIAVRFVIATALFLPFVLRLLPGVSRRAVRQGLVLGGLLCAGFIVQTVGMQYTSASKSGFITGLLVVFTPIFQVALERRMPRPGNVLGIALVVIGLFFLTSPEGSSFNLGDFLVLLCAIVFGLYIVLLDQYAREADFRVLTFFQFAVTLIVTAGGALVMEEARVAWSMGFVFTLAYLAVLATLVTLVLQTRYQKDTTPTRAAVIFSLEPVIAAVLAYLFRDERIGALGIVGGMLIVGGLLVSELSDQLFPARAQSPGM